MVGMKLIHAYTLAITLIVSSLTAEEKIETTTGPVTIIPISHATVLLKQGDFLVAVDPVGDAAPLLKHGKPDLILITHIHGDHYSRETVKALLTDKAQIITPDNVGKKLGDLGNQHVMANGDKTVAGKLTVEAVPMHNTTQDRLKFHPKGLGNGYVLTFGKTRIYISGDTEGLPELRSLKNIHTAFMCMNVPYTMTVEKAAELVKEIKPKVVYPYHFRNGDGSKGDMILFKKLVEQTKDIDVRVLDWYPSK